MHVLLVEDDEQVASFIRRGMKDEQFDVDVASDGESALDAAGGGDYDLVVLDWRLPKRNGLEVLQSLRGNGSPVPVLMLTARDELADKVSSFDAGADDYLTKPFSFEELMARVRALMRRRGSLMPTVLRVADLELDSLRHRARRGERRLDLTNREYAILEQLMRNAGHVVSRTMLAEHVWEQDFDPMSNVIDVHIARLRRKVDTEGEPKLLRTVRGSGYLIQDPATPVD
jgi:DNA-binding response OmpR family regulator